MRFIHLLHIIALVTLLGACAQETPQPAAPTQHDHAHHPVVILRHSQLNQGPLDQHAHHLVEQVAPFQHVGLYLDGPRPSSLQWRTQNLDGVWAQWQPVPLTWSEGEHHVGRILLASPTTSIEFRGGDGLEMASVQLYPHWPAQPSRLAKNLPKETSIQTGPTSDLRIAKQAVAPESLVISREKWGARNPGKICGNVVAPYRMSIHHTAQPDSDGGDPPARMRQMQAYHMDNNGWCDIGYHFVVSQSGKIYQGRSDERRPGAHVGNQNAGNIGISFIGNYQTSTPPQAQLDAATRIMAWIKDTYNITWDRDHVKGHRQWPGQSTSCPGDNLLSKIDELMGNNPTPKTYDVDIQVNFLGDALKDIHTQGSSQSIKDVMVNDTLQAEIILTNKNDEALRGVKLAYLIEQPYLSATNYTIQTDWPAKDKTTWMTNDADANPDNPAKDQMGQTGVLNMNAFGAGETKRVLIDLKATQYSLGAIDHPDVRGWVQNIDNVYGEQNNWDQMPTTNLTNKQLQAFTQLDILAPDQWQWDVPEESDTEGWQSCGDSALARDLNNGALLVTQTGEAPCITSSPWTRIDAASWPQLVLRLKSNIGQHTHTLTWSVDGQDYAAYFEHEATGDEETLIVALGQQDGWSGEISSLTLALGGSSHAIDAVFFQNEDNKQTNTPTEMLAKGEVMTVTPGTPTIKQPKDPNDPKTPIAPQDPNNDEKIAVNGCASTPGAPAPTAPLIAIVMGMVMGLIRRRP